MIRFFRKYHKWLGVLFAYFLIEFGVSGIILNHRKFFSGVDVNRRYLPREYRYRNWNLASVKSTLKFSDDSILIYGNIGIWLTDSSFSRYSDFSEGFRRGIDNRKIEKMVYYRANILAGTYFGLYRYSYDLRKWEKVYLPVREERISDLSCKGDTLLVLTRSYLLETTDLVHFKKIVLPEPENYDNKVSLFKTIWLIHSGAIYGEVGKLIVDLAGLIFIFLTITGLIIFINRYELRLAKKTDEKKKKLVKSSKWNLKWHNKIGWISSLLILITASTGMFLRPPVLLFIDNARVGKIPYTELAGTNAWYDKLRVIEYFDKAGKYIVGTSEGFYYCDKDFKKPMKYIKKQPQISVMGINVFRKKDSVSFLVGSFAGMYQWQPEASLVLPYPRGFSMNEVKDFDVSGYSADFGSGEFIFNYGSGAMNCRRVGKGVLMPKKIRELPMSLWNTALEIHTARIYEPLLGEMYILIVPIVGIVAVFLILAGFIVWLRQKHKI
jgi:hypothetical protein